MFVQVINSEIIGSTNRLPGSARRLSDGAWLSPPDANWSITEHESCGWFDVADPLPRPADTVTDTWDLGPYTLDPSDIPLPRQWIQRPKTQDELDEDADETERTAVRTLLPQIRTIAQATPWTSSGGNTNSRLNALENELEAAATRDKTLARALRRVIRDVLGDA